METDMSKSTNPRADVYTRVTDRIIADLDRGVRPWMKPWNANNAAEHITRPLRHNGARLRRAALSVTRCASLCTTSTR